MASAVTITVNGATAVIASQATGPQGPPGPSVSPGAAGQFYVTNAAATAPVWDSTFTIASPGVTAALISGATLKQTQGGTLVSPSDERTLVVQPRDSTKGPFQIYLSGAKFNNTWDDTWAVGYNPDLGNADEALYWRLEQDYEVTPGTHWFEYYIEYIGTNRGHSFRPIYLNVDKATEAGQLLFHLPSINTGGSIAFLSGDETQNYLTLNNNGLYQRNNFHWYTYDSTVTARNAFYTSSANYMVIGDTGLVGTILQAGTDGFYLESNGTTKFTDASVVTRASINTTHGFATFGGGGSDYVAALGPAAGEETAKAALYLLANGSTPSATNFAVLTNGAITVFNTVSGTGTFYWFQADSTELTEMDHLGLRLITPPLIQFGTGLSTGTVGTNKSGASLVLQAGAAVTNQTLTATAAAFGGSGATAPLTVDWSTSTTPFIKSGTSATSLSVGTNKSGAALHFQAGAAADAIVLTNPGAGSIVAATTQGQKFAHQVTKSSNYTIDSAGAGDEQVWMQAACTITLPNPSGSAGRVLEVIVGYDPAVGGGTIARNGSENINGAASNITLATGDKFSILQIRCDGTNWIIKGGLSI